jgi:hypothetical protein
MFGNARDALFELGDAVIQMRLIHSFAELSCAPAFRRKWSSAYEALQDGRPDRAGLMRLYLEQTAAPSRLILAGDHTAWQRLWAERLAGRSYQHQPSAIPGRRPVTIGHGYSTIAIIPEEHGSWALPLVHERISDQKPVEAAAGQLRQVCQYLAVRPLAIFDSEYGCALFLLASADIQADKLIRLRTNLSLEGPTKPRKAKGQPPKHGIKFKFKDPETWWQPNELIECNDPVFGPLTVRIWQGLRFSKALDCDPVFGPLTVRIWQGLRFSKALDCRMSVAQVERQQAPGTRRKPRILWFAWVGADPPAQWWSLYTRRYPIDHWYRFAKGRLHWTLPQLATPEQGERWSDLMPFITWELWLARSITADNPLPWQKPSTQLSPGRVCQGMQNILVAIGTPARVCKSRGKSPGWPKGKPRAARAHHDLIRSERWKAIRARKRASQDTQKPKRGRPKKDTTINPA